MRSASVLAALAPALANAHYLFPDLIFNHNTTSDWEYVRETTNHYSHGPVTDVTDDQILCYELAGRPAAKVATVAAGDEIGFSISPDMQHPGPGLVYMAKVPTGSDVTTWEPTGDEVWFKITETPPTANASGLQWPLQTGDTSWNFTIPAETPSGDYLVRVEHIALHGAEAEGGAQFYLACGQITLTGGGSGTPSPLVAFPGAYKATDPGILINLYNPVPTNYTMPGPALWPATSDDTSAMGSASPDYTGSSADTDSSAGSSAAASSPAAETSAAAVSTSAAPTTSAVPTTSSAPSVAAVSASVSAVGGAVLKGF